MTRVRCRYCGGEGKYKSGISAVTGEVFIDECPVCRGEGYVGKAGDDWITENDAQTDMKQKIVEDSIKTQIKNDTTQAGIILTPDAFKK